MPAATLHRAAARLQELVFEGPVEIRDVSRVKECQIHGKSDFSLRKNQVLLGLWWWWGLVEVLILKHDHFE